MYLYRFEVNLGNSIFPVVVAAADDQQAFRLVDTELEKHFLYEPETDEIILHEKKRIRTGNAYVLFEQDPSARSVSNL
ncbi:DUF3906 family protein [Bacillus massiliigorillae]|uniref:DUF3906 family protein n=1 Tax=Bacillus massiliigorillae TaxID=1243664 RepID=UPI0003A7696D|nr:DUF3906 family protein [Bacillus massiliigorillae]